MINTYLSDDNFSRNCPMMSIRDEILLIYMRRTLRQTNLVKNYSFSLLWWKNCIIKIETNMNFNMTNTGSKNCTTNGKICMVKY